MPLIVRTIVLLVLLAAPFFASAQPTMPGEVPVRLVDGATDAWILGADGGPLHFLAGDGTGNALTRLSPGEEATLRTRGQEIYVQTADLSFFALSVQAVPGEGAMLRVAPVGTQVPSRRYAGRLDVTVDSQHDGQLRLINQVPLDDYVAAVVSREYGFDDLEGAKAMAILARTYALHQIDVGAPLGDHVLSQKYDGADRMTAAAQEATRQTQGEVLTYRGNLIEAVYFSSSGGHTADNEAVWDGARRPYLRGVPDPYDANSPHASWSSSIPRDRLLRVLSETYGFEVGGFHLGNRSRDGRVRSIKLLRGNRPLRDIGSNDFRLLVNRHFGTNSMKSTLFDARREGNRYVFTGSGFGHGVGLSQYGALEMSRRGHSYRDILAFYFTDVRVERRDGTPTERWAGLEEASETSPAPVTWSTEAPPRARVPEGRPVLDSSRRRVGW